MSGTRPWRQFSTRVTKKLPSAQKGKPSKHGFSFTLYPNGGHVSPANKNVWNNLKGTSALVMLLPYRTPSPPLLRAVSLHREEFSWPENFLSLPDYRLIVKSSGHFLIHGGACVPLSCLQSDRKISLNFINQIKSACRQIPLSISLESKLNIHAFIHSVNNLLCSC